jgi:hypothetical protein
VLLTELLDGAIALRILLNSTLTDLTQEGRGYVRDQEGQIVQVVQELSVSTMFMVLFKSPNLNRMPDFRLQLANGLNADTC